MYGNLLSNKQIEQMVRGPGNFSISPYRKDHQKLAHYKLSPGRVMVPGPLRADRSRGRPTQVGDLRDGVQLFKPQQYLIVEVLETIRLPEGILGQFTPASTLIEQGFGLVAGKLDSEYGARGERIIVGLTNLLNEDNPFNPRLGLAHVSFADFRGTERRLAKFTKQERDDFDDRRFPEDGPDYHRDDPED